MTETLLVITAWLGGDSAIRWHAVENVLTCTGFKTVGLSNHTTLAAHCNFPHVKLVPELMLS